MKTLENSNINSYKCPEAFNLSKKIALNWIDIGKLRLI